MCVVQLGGRVVVLFGEWPATVTKLDAGGASKQATLETGLAVRVPLFIKEGEVVRVNTQTGEVAGRA